MESFRLLWQRPPSDCPLSQLVHASRHVAGGASGKRWGCVTGASGSTHTDRAVERHRPPSRLPPPITSDSCTVLRLTLVLEPRFALTRASSQNPFRRMHVRYVA